MMIMTYEKKEIIKKKYFNEIDIRINNLMRVF